MFLFCPLKKNMSVEITIHFLGFYVREDTTVSELREFVINLLEKKA